MPEFTSFLQKVGARIRDAEYRRQVQEEILDHLETAALEYETQGMTPESARAKAMQDFGDPDGIGLMLQQSEGGAEQLRRWRVPLIVAACWYLMGFLLYMDTLVWRFIPLLGGALRTTVALPFYLAHENPHVVWVPWSGKAGHHIDALWVTFVLTAFAWLVYLNLSRLRTLTRVSIHRAKTLARLRVKVYLR